MSIFSDIESFITTKAWPFLKNIGKSVVQAEINNLEPIAAKLVSDAEGAIVRAAASGSVSNLGAVLGDLVTKTAAQAEMTAVSAGATSLLSSIGTALAANPNTATSLAVVPKPTPSA